MQPNNPKAKSSAAGLARARMFAAAHLGWLNGYPLVVQRRSVLWQTVPDSHDVAPQQIELDTELLQKAIETRNRLIARYPRALPKMVGKVETWQRSTDQLFHWLHDALRHAVTPPRNLLTEEHPLPRAAVQRGLELRRNHAALRPLINAVAWMNWLQPRAFQRDVDWIFENQNALATIATNLDAKPRIDDLVTLLVLVRRTGARAVETVLDLLGDADIWNVSLAGGRPYVAEMAKRFQRKQVLHFPRRLPPAPRPAAAAGQLLRFCRQMRRQPRAVALRCQTLLALLYPKLPVAEWQPFWERVDTFRAWALSGGGPLNTAAKATLEAHMETLTSDFPPEVHLASTLDEIGTVALDEHRKYYDLLLPILQAVPATRGSQLLRAAMFGYVTSEYWSEPERIRLVLHALRTHLPAVAAGQIFDFDSEVLYGWEASRTCWLGLLDLIGDEDTPHTRASLTCGFACIAALNRKGRELKERQKGQLLTLALASPQPDLVLARAQALRRHQEDGLLDWDHVQLAHQLAGDDPIRFAATVRAVEDAVRFSSAFQTLHKQLHAAGWPHMVAGLLIDQRQPDLLRLGASIELLRQLESPCPRPQPRPQRLRLPSWATAYPAEFHDDLRLLSACAAQPREQAAKLLSACVSDAAQIKQEIAKLEQQLRKADDPVRRDRIQLRIERLRQPFVPNARALRRCQSRLAAAVRQAVFGQWTERVNEALARVVRKNFGQDVGPGFLHSGEMRAITAALRLPPETRKLARQLIHRRLQPEPWLWHDHARNQKFVNRMTELGVNMEPWLASMKDWRPDVCRPLRVYFSADPFEIFQMGAFFGTCLSPGNFNFFSVFANAADVNKRVLFARDEKGDVAGRCLFAMTDSGSIVTFYPYAHESGEDFAAHVQGVAQELAEACGTVVSDSGHVSTLVATRWYDDGVCSKNVFDEANWPSYDWRGLRPGQLRTRLEQLLDPVPLSPTTVGATLALPIFRQRPELVRELFPVLRKTTHLAPKDLDRAIRLSIAAGAEEMVTWLLKEHETRYLLVNKLEDERRAARLGQHLPVVLLRLLRQTRALGIRSDAEEPWWRRTLYAQAYRKLGRENRARNLEA